LPFVGDIFPKTPSLDEVRLPILLPGRVGNGITTRPSIAVMTLKELTDIAAPKLSQNEEIFAIGLAQGARQFFGDEIGDLIKGERVLSANSVDLVLKAVRSGVLGRSDLISPETAEPVIQVVQSAVESLRRGRKGVPNSQNEQELFEALQNLTPDERVRFDEIVNELTQRAIKRTVDRLSSIERLF